MKKIITLTLALFLLCSCSGKGNPPQTPETEISATVPAEQVTTETKVEPQLDNEEILEELIPAMSVFVPSEYLETFRQNKSLSDIWDNIFISGNKQDNKYYLMFMNSHQGSGQLFIDTIEKNNEEYIIKASCENYGCELIYKQGEEVVICKPVGKVPFWPADKESVEFVRIVLEDNDFSDFLAKELFDGISDVEIKEDGVYATKDDKTYKISVIYDYVVDFTIDSSFSGIIKVTDVNDENSDKFLEYTYENGKISVEEIDTPM